VSTMKPKPWIKTCFALVVLACLSTQIGCSHARPTYFVTGSDYIVLEKDQAYVAPRKMVLATESLVQKKDEQILDLLRVNEKLIRELELSR